MDNWTMQMELVCTESVHMSNFSLFHNLVTAVRNYSNSAKRLTSSQARGVWWRYSTFPDNQVAEICSFIAITQENVT